MNPPDNRTLQDISSLSSDNNHTCSVCHSSPPVNAIQLDCNHIFCYLCIKSALETINLCPLCRAEVGVEFNFKQHSIIGATSLPSPSQEGTYWFYEGFRGWWLFDADTNNELEEAYQRRQACIEKYIAGSFYSIDILNRFQRRKDSNGRARKICRSTLHLENILGLSGLKCADFNEILDMMRSA